MSENGYKEVGKFPWWKYTKISEKKIAIFQFWKAHRIQRVQFNELLKFNFDHFVNSYRQTFGEWLRGFSGNFFQTFSRFWNFWAWLRGFSGNYFQVHFMSTYPWKNIFSQKRVMTQRLFRKLFPISVSISLPEFTKFHRFWKKFPENPLSHSPKVCLYGLNVIIFQEMMYLDVTVVKKYLTFYRRPNFGR